MGFTKTFLTGAAEQLVADGLGVWSPTAAYTDDHVGIVLSLVPKSPSQAITLSAYTVDHDPSLPDSVMGLQIRHRGTPDPTVCDDMADKAFDIFHSRHDYTLPSGVAIQQSFERTRVSGGMDDNRRWSMIQNFYFYLAHPAPHRV